MHFHNLDGFMCVSNARELESMVLFLEVGKLYRNQHKQQKKKENLGKTRWSERTSRKFLQERGSKPKNCLDNSARVCSKKKIIQDLV